MPRHDYEHPHDLEHCVEYGRRIGVQLARGNFTAARSSLAFAVGELTEAGQTLPLRDFPIVRLPGVNIQISNALAKHVGAVFVVDLRGIPQTGFDRIPLFSERRREVLRLRLEAIGLPFPLPAYVNLDREVELQPN